jgi:hypothetical protein
MSMTAGELRVALDGVKNDATLYALLNGRSPRLSAEELALVLLQAKGCCAEPPARSTCNQEKR